MAGKRKGTGRRWGVVAAVQRGGAGVHADRRTRRERSRGDARRAAVERARD